MNVFWPLEISQNSQENTCAKVFKKEIQVFFCEFCKISQNTFFTEHFQCLLLECEQRCDWDPVKHL